MRLQVIAVGTRMPPWVDAAVEEYRRRLRPPWRLTVTELESARRRADGPARARAAEAKAILARLGPDDFVVPLDEHGSEPSTLELAGWLTQRQAAGQELVFVVGGPDGLAEEVLSRGQMRWSLSRLTFAHGLCRVVLLEQIYRAACVIAGHPYHRE